jgi:cold shock CspA family protein
VNSSVSKARMRGTVIRLLPNKGFGFVRDSENRTRFIHAKEFTVPGTFDQLQVGYVLEFEPVADGHGGDGLRCVDIKQVET